MMTLPLRLLRTVSLAALLVSAPTFGAMAQDAAAPAAEAATPAAPAATPETVVATVSGEPITEADLSFAAEDLAQDLAQMPPEERRAFLLRVLIDMKVKIGRAHV